VTRSGDELVVSLPETKVRGPQVIEFDRA
jgi:hypothetical protein